MTAEVVMAAIAALASIGGWAAFWRARSQNELDRAKAGEAKEQAESTNVETAERVVAFVNREMDRLRKETDRQVNALSEEVSKLRGALDVVQRERDALSQENSDLRTRVGKLEGRIGVLTDELARAATAPPIEVQVHPPDARPGGRRTTDPPEK